MQTVTINFTVSGQTLNVTNLPINIASNTVKYVKAVFALDSDWTGFDVVSAIWYNDFAQIAVVLDENGECMIPHEVLARPDDVMVNLVGRDIVNDELVDRLTTYPAKALDVDANAKITGTETAPVTPSQFEQYVAIVEQLVGSVKDIDHTELNADYTLTIYYTDGTSDTVGPIRGAQGEAGNGILSAVLNPDYTLTLNYTNGQHDTVGPIRGAQGETGNGIQSIYLTGTSGAVKTYTILFTDGNTTEFQVTDGEVTNAVLESLMPTDTANGSIASFPDGQSVFPLKSLTAEINPIQDLHGYDSPWVGGGHYNQWDEQWELGSYNSSGAKTSSSTSIRTTNKIPVLPSTTYYFKCPSQTGRTCFYDENETHINADVSFNANSTFTTPANAYYMTFVLATAYGTTYNNDIAVNYPSSVTTYSPYSNICPISGWNSVGVVDCGKNLLDADEIEQGSFDSPTAPNNSITDYFLIKGGETYTLSAMNYAGRYLRFFDASKTEVDSSTRISIYNNNSYTFITASWASYMRVMWYNSGGVTPASVKADKPQIEVGSTATTYEPYNGTTHTTTLPSTVYGGTLDVVSGELTVDRAIVNLGTLYWTYANSRFTAAGADNPSIVNAKQYGNTDTPNIICSAYATSSRSNLSNGQISLHYSGQNYINVMDSNYTDAPTFKSAMNGVQLVYELATPTTIQLTPTQVQTLLGTNNIFADSGNVSVEYVADIQGYIDKKL